MLTLCASLCSSSESGPEPRLPGNRLPVLTAFQPLYPPNHVSYKAQLASVFIVIFFPSAYYLHFLLATGKLVAWSTASLCLWVLPLPAPRLPFHGPFSLFCGPSHPEGMNTDGRGTGAPHRHQEGLLPTVAPVGMDSADQSCWSKRTASTLTLNICLSVFIMSWDNLHCPSQPPLTDCFLPLWKGHRALTEGTNCSPPLPLSCNLSQKTPETSGLWGL